MSTKNNEVKKQATLEALKSDFPLTNLLKMHKQAQEKELVLVKRIINEHKH